MTLKQVRATFDRETITVYQAFSPVIVEAAVKAGTFVTPFSFQRMTWIKPSFLWMMERCGWATKPNQQRVVAVRVHRWGWEEALANAVLTSPAQGQGSEEWREELDRSPIRVQWDPERNLHGGKTSQRSIQVGIAREWSRRYADEWLVDLEDITPLVRKIADKRRTGDWKAAERALPVEKPYPMPESLKTRLEMD